MVKKKLLIVGGGDLGLQVLKLLAPRNAFHVFMAGNDRNTLDRRCERLRQVCLQHGTVGAIQPVVMELSEAHVEENSASICRIRPDIILNCATLHSPWSVSGLAAGVDQALGQAQLGPWLPLYLAPAYELMRAVKHSGSRALVVNAAFPDAVNAVLDKVGLAPDTGVGSVANLIAATALSIARLAVCPPEEVQVRLVAPHYLSHNIPLSGLPPIAHYHLGYRIRNVDCSAAFDDAAIFEGVRNEFQRMGGIEAQFMTAASAVRVLEHLFCDEEILTHVPGPSGLPGGYPVRVGMGRVLLALPDGVSRAEAIAANQLGQRQDGIAAIQPDGSVAFESEHMAVMETLLGFSMSRLPLQDVHQWADELGRKYREFAQAG